MHRTSSPSAAQSVSDDLLQAAQAFFPDFTAAEAIAGHPEVARVTTPTGTGRVRRWPAGVLAADIDFSREVMATAKDAGITPVLRLVTPPTTPGEPSLRIGNRHFDAQMWLPGTPPPRSEAAWPNPEDCIDIPVVLTPVAFSAVIAASARLHDATTAIATRPGIPTAPLSMLPGAVRQAHGRHLGALRARARRERAIQRWLATGERLMAAAEPIVATATEDPGLSTSVLHLGFWPAHVLLEGDLLTG